VRLKDLETLVDKGESESLEFKRSTGQRTEAAKTVCAMLNGLGGIVVFGVEDNGEIVGQEVSAHTLEDIARELRRIEPPVFPEMKTVTLDNGRKVITVLADGGRGPYLFDGRAYLRHGTTTSVMPQDEYERRLLERLHATRRWENEPVAEGVTTADLDQEEIQLTVENAVRTGRLEPLRSRDMEVVLRGLGLIVDDRLLNAAVVLYGKSAKLEAIYPQCAIRLARFRGKDRLADFADNRQYWGHAFDLLRRAESFLRDHVPIAGRVIPGRLVREDLPAYPPRATREALANALCHRDYAIPGGAVAVAMYDDHLEITNPGTLHFGITPEQLTRPHESKPWNPIIAGVFYRAGVIERWGSGTLNILDWCRENGNPAPAWSHEAGSVFVTFAPVPGAVPAGRESGLESGARVGLESGAEVKAGDLLRSVLVSLQAGPLSRLQIARQLGHTRVSGAVNRTIRQLMDESLIEYTLPAKPNSRLQKYRLTEKGRQHLDAQRTSPP
jgi:ATP-dependent DNA helicase RecG